MIVLRLVLRIFWVGGKTKSFCRSSLAIYIFPDSYLTAVVDHRHRRRVRGTEQPITRSNGREGARGARSLSPAIRSEGPLSIRRRMSDPARILFQSFFPLSLSLFVSRVWIFEQNSNSRTSNLQVVLNSVICCLIGRQVTIFVFSNYRKL